MLEQVTINLHSSIRIEDGKTIYFDPFRVAESSNDADIIFVTHDHYDHFSPEDVAKVMKADTVFVAPASTAALIRNTFSVSDERIVVVAPGDSIEVLGISVEAIASYNPGKQFHPKANGWVGYVVTLGGLRYYVCGDMDITEEGKGVSCDVLLVPCGGKYTMDPDEAAEFTGILKPKYAVPTHYGDPVGDKSCGGAFAEKVKANSPETQVVFKLG